MADLERRLTGAMGTKRGKVTLSTGHVITPPSWWIDDDEATASNFAAMAEMSGG